MDQARLVQIYQKADIEPFLVTEFKDVSKKPEDLGELVSAIATNRLLDRVLIEGKTRVEFSTAGRLNCIMTLFDGAILRTGVAGGLEIASPNDKNFHMRVVPTEQKDGKLVAVKTDALLYLGENLGHVEKATELMLRGNSDLYANITVHPDADIYAIKCVNGDQAILLRDEHFWKSVGEKTGLELIKAEPGYTDKSPVTPWYRATDKKSGAQFYMGCRWTVDDLRVAFKKAVRGKVLDDAFGEVEETKEVNGRYTRENISHDACVNSFVVHTHKRYNVMPFVNKLLEIARAAK